MVASGTPVANEAFVYCPVTLRCLAFCLTRGGLTSLQLWIRVDHRHSAAVFIRKRSTHERFGNLAPVFIA